MTEDPYLIPGTGTLRNVPGLTDRRQLEVFEVRASTARITQLVSGEVTIAGRWDLDHLMAHHWHIFQDVYPFAGKTRDVSISKDSPDGHSTTHFCEPVHIQEQGAHIFNDLTRGNHLRGLERSEFVAGAAHVLVEVNYLHPGREGNGRARGLSCSVLLATPGGTWTGRESTRSDTSTPPSSVRSAKGTDHRQSARWSIFSMRSPPASLPLVLAPHRSPPAVPVRLVAGAEGRCAVPASNPPLRTTETVPPLGSLTLARDEDPCRILNARADL